MLTLLLQQYLTANFNHLFKILRTFEQLSKINETDILARGMGLSELSQIRVNITLFKQKHLTNVVKSKFQP